MPVAQGGPPPARQAVMIGVAALLGVLAIAFVVTRFDRLTGGSDPIEVEVGDPEFTLGQVDELARTVAETGPLLLPDASGGNRDLHVQHLGDDPDQGWLAFAVRPEGADRNCFAEWQPDQETFVDTCDGTVYPPDGAGLAHYGVSVSADGALTIDLGETVADDGSGN